MADVTVTAANVRGTPDDRGIADTTLTAGLVVFKDSSDSNEVKASDANNTSLDEVTGITVNGASAGQYIGLVTQSGAQVTFGAVLTAGLTYFLSRTSGGLCPEADLTTGDRKVRIGYASTTSILVLDIKDYGVIL